MSGYPPKIDPVTGIPLPVQPISKKRPRVDKEIPKQKKPDKKDKDSEKADKVDGKTTFPSYSALQKHLEMKRELLSSQFGNGESFAGSSTLIPKPGGLFPPTDPSKLSISAAVMGPASQNLTAKERKLLAMNALAISNIDGSPAISPRKTPTSFLSEGLATAAKIKRVKNKDKLVSNENTPTGGAISNISASNHSNNSNRQVISQGCQTVPLATLLSQQANISNRYVKESHSSISAERRFFDQVKDVLVANSREAWHEFIKCLELFSNDLLKREDLIELVEDLFGANNSDLLHEFQRLLENRVDYESHKEDLWYAVPLSEIDFSQCRKCTPSYRALPGDYPKPKCTERSEEEIEELNDTWVSIPIGSEESSSFKHMRKNQYEEALFKCEDERFEIDMIIDSNINTIRILEPLAEEISQLSKIDNPDNSLAGMTPRFTFQLEKRNLSTVHLNAIARIYGEHGDEILELLRKNPAG